MARRRGVQKRKTSMGLILVMVLAIFGTVRYARAGLDEQREKLLGQVDSINKQIMLEEQRTEEIEDLRAYIQTKQYVEDMAREKFGLVYENEVIIQAQK